MQGMKEVNCEECQSVLTVRSHREFADHLHTADCPLRYPRSETVFQRQELRNEPSSELITESDIEEILSVVEVYPSDLWDGGIIPNHISDTDASQSETIDRESLSEPSMIEANDTGTGRAKCVVGNQQFIPQQGLLCGGSNTALTSTKRIDEESCQDMITSSTSAIANTPENYPTVQVENNDSNSLHICQAPLFIGRDIVGFKDWECTGCDGTKFLHNNLHRMKSPTPEEDFEDQNEGTLTLQCYNRAVGMKDSQEKRSSNGSEDKAKDEGKSLNTLSDIENIEKQHSRMRADTANGSDVKKETSARRANPL